MDLKRAKMWDLSGSAVQLNKITVITVDNFGKLVT